MNKEEKKNKIESSEFARWDPTHSHCFIQSLAKVLPADSILSIGRKANKHTNKTNKIFTSSPNRAMNATAGMKRRYKEADKKKAHTHIHEK